MTSTTACESLDQLALDVYEVVRLLSLAGPRKRRRMGDLKEGEFLTLAMLHERGTMVVGDIQRRLGVLPAQMSRIIRALEDRSQGLVACQINSQDKRKIDVRLTPEGEQALEDFRQFRVGRILQILEDLHESEQEALAAVLERVQEIVRDKFRTDLSSVTSS